MAHRLPLGVFVAGVLALCAVEGARAACPNIGMSYSAQLGISEAAGLKAADDTCIEGSPVRDACNSFVGMVLDKYFGYPDFKVAGRYLNAPELNTYLPSSMVWTLLGYAGEQLVLDQAQVDANNGAPVIALSRNQVALVIPSRSLYHSPTWNLCVPMSAAHFVDDPTRNYTSSLLSDPWETPHGVVIWERTGPLTPHMQSLPAPTATLRPSPLGTPEPL